MSKKRIILIVVCIILAISILLIVGINKKEENSDKQISYQYSEEDKNDNWDENETTNLIITDENNEIKIDKQGTYHITGTTTNGSVIVDAGSEDTVRLILDNVNITCENSSPIYVKQAKKVIITLAENSINTLTDGITYVYDDEANEEPNAVLFSNDDLTINGTGILNIKANFEDGIKSDDTIIIVNSNINIEAEDDGINSNDGLYINEATINITKSTEGIESSIIEINGGNINIVSSDDGINVAGDDESINRTLTINEGEIYVNASGDGIDVNGSGYINGGTVKVDGPTNSGNSALDYDKEFVITNGNLIACGSAGMTQSISNSSSVYCLDITFTQIQNAGSEIKITDEDGNTVLAYSPSKQYQSAIICSPNLSNGKQYTIYVDSNEVDTVTVESTITNVGNMGMNNMMPNGGIQMPNMQIPEGEVPSGEIQRPEGQMQKPNRSGNM